VTSLRLNAAGEPLEISLTRDLRHTGVMATLGYAYADAAASPNYSKGGCSSSSSSQRGSGDHGRSGKRSVVCGGTRTCWMLFEYCDKGVLAVSWVIGWVGGLVVDVVQRDRDVLDWFRVHQRWRCWR
jgi:hypothetical protein